MDIESTPKCAEHAIVGRREVETLIGCPTSQDRRQGDFNKVDSTENNLCPKNARNRRGYQYGTCSLKYVTMLALGYPILFMSVWACLLEKSTMRLKDRSHDSGDILTSTISVKYLNFALN